MWNKVRRFRFLQNFLDHQQEVHGAYRLLCSVAILDPCKNRLVFIDFYDLFLQPDECPDPTLASEHGHVDLEYAY